MYPQVVSRESFETLGCETGTQAPYFVKPSEDQCIFESESIVYGSDDGDQIQSRASEVFHPHNRGSCADETTQTIRGSVVQRFHSPSPSSREKHVKKSRITPNKTSDQSPFNATYRTKPVSPIGKPRSNNKRKTVKTQWTGLKGQKSINDKSPGQKVPAEADVASPASSPSKSPWGALTRTMVDEYAEFPKCAVGLVEVETFYGRNECPSYMHRILSNGITLEQRATIQLYARELNTKPNIHRRYNALKYWATRNGMVYWKVDTFHPSNHYGALAETVTDYDASAYVHRQVANGRMRDPSLLELAFGVKNFPEDDDAGILTQCVRHAIQTRNDGLRASDVVRLAEDLGFVMPDASKSKSWDQNARDRILIRATAI